MSSRLVGFDQYQVNPLYYTLQRLGSLQCVHRGAREEERAFFRAGATPHTGTPLCPDTFFPQFSQIGYREVEHMRLVEEQSEGPVPVRLRSCGKRQGPHVLVGQAWETGRRPQETTNNGERGHVCEHI